MTNEAGEVVVLEVDGDYYDDEPRIVQLRLRACLAMGKSVFFKNKFRGLGFRF